MGTRSLWVALLVLPLMVSCGKKSLNTTNDSSSGTGSGSTDGFTQAAISKSWVSDCTAATEPIVGDTYYKTYLTLESNGSFEAQIYWNTASNCSNATYNVVYTIYGTYSLGGYVNGSTTTKILNFTIDFADYSGTDLMTYGSTVRTAYNTDCGGTSPFTGG